MDAITDAVAAVTMAAIMAVITDVADGVFPVEITPAAIFCGSSSFCVCVATTAGDVAMAAATIAVAAAAADIHRRKKREGAHRLPPFQLVKVAKAGNSLAFAASHAASAERSLTVPLASRRLGRAPSLPSGAFS